MHKANALAIAIAGFFTGLIGAELCFGHLRDKPQEPPAPLVFSLEVRDATGELLASPLLVGEEGRKLHLDLSQPPGGPRGPQSLHGVGDSPGLQMSLDLDPQPSGGDAVCLGYRLSIDAGFPHSGRIGMSYGERRSVDLRGNASLKLTLTVARANTPHMRKLLQARGRPLI